MLVYPAITFGLLPVECINTLLNEHLETGLVRLSKQAREHIARDHPEDYAFCLAHLAETIANPTYIGKAPWHFRNFEMVRLIEQDNLLVAIGLEPNKFGNYAIKSAYCLSYAQVRQRLESKHLLIPKQKKPSPKGRLLNGVLRQVPTFLHLLARLLVLITVFTVREAGVLTS